MEWVAWEAADMAWAAWVAWVGRRSRAWAGFGSGMNGNTTRRPPAVRTTLTLGFELGRGPGAEVSSTIAEHLVALPALHWQGPVQVEMQGRTAILRGMAATEHDRDLAERVVRLEATVDQVQNQIAVVGQALPRMASPASDTRQEADILRRIDSAARQFCGG